MNRSPLLGIAGLVAAAGLLAGCGSAGEPTADKSSTSTTPAASSSATPTLTAKPKAAPKPLPQCSDIWVADKRLPGGYHGCAPDGPLRLADRYYCESGQVLVTFHNRYYAARTGRIFHVADVEHDAGFHHRLTVCRG